MRLLLTGLGFFATALALAVLPVVAHGGPVTQNVACTITGTEGPDLLWGTAGRDVICGLGGADIITAKAGNDVIKGGPGNDVLQGDHGRDALFGGLGNDKLYARLDRVHDHANCGPGARDYASTDGGVDVRYSCELGAR
jgi:Ca2+-binding RTX toxin-like protein